MSAEPIPIPAARNTALDTSSLSSQPSSLPLWDRITTWASENKAVAYTIAGVAVVVSGAGVVYYLSDSRKGGKDEAAEEKKRASKKERRKAKKEKEKEKESRQPEAREAAKEQGKHDSGRREFSLTAHLLGTAERTPTVESDPSEDLPQVDESTVDSLSEQVGLRFTPLA